MVAYIRSKSCANVQSVCLYRSNSLCGCNFGCCIALFAQTVDCQNGSHLLKNTATMQHFALACRFLVPSIDDSMKRGEFPLAQYEQHKVDLPDHGQPSA
jgi:hypothetical protein